MITKTYCGRTDGPHGPHGWGVLPNLRACAGEPPRPPAIFSRASMRLSVRYPRALVGAR